MTGVKRFEPVEASKLAIMLNGDEVQEFSDIVVCSSGTKKVKN
jgi:hypothetical protein